MKSVSFRRSGAHFAPIACGLLAYAFAIATMAQKADGVPLGVPLDWSHRHIIHPNPDTLEEAAAKGTLDQWMKKADDPRFVLQLEKKLARLQAAADAEDDELVTDGRAGGVIAINGAVA